jgi:hypothetical protein
MIKIITSFSMIKVAEGKRLSYTLTTMDDNGNIIESNARKSFAVIDPALDTKLVDIENYILNRENA